MNSSQVRRPDCGPIARGGDVQARRRLGLFTVVVVLAGALLFGRLVQLQVVKADELRRIAVSQYRHKVILEPHRGTIYDRNGQPMTENSSDYYSISINPYNVPDPARLAGELAEVTGKHTRTFMSRLKRSNRCVVLARKIKPEQAEKLKSLGWQLILSPETHRRYPHRTTAGQLIGFNDIDNKGISGIELSFDNLLRGQPGWRVVQLDVQGNQHVDNGYPYKLQIDGGNLVTTIDMSIQSVLEEELSRGLALSRGKSGTGIVLDPHTGEIIAMASQPSFDPNRPRDFPTSRQKNLSLTDMYEPGSTFKIVPAALLLEDYNVKPDRVVDSGPGYITIHGSTIHDAHGYGELTFMEVVAKSSNVGMIKLTGDVKYKDLYNKIKEFGLLERTGIELSGEASGSIPPVKKWSGLTRPNVVIGQGVAVTMLQMAMVYGSVANGGFLLKPTLVRELHHADGTISAPRSLASSLPLSLASSLPCSLASSLPRSLAPRRIMAPETAETLREFLIATVERGTGRRAGIKNMVIAGKTGTAQLVDTRRGGYYKDRFHTSFIGFFPANNPIYLVSISINDPHGPNGEHTGGSVCAPVFRRICERILGMRPDLWTLADTDEDVLAADRIVVPDLSGRDMVEVERQLNLVGLKAVAHGRGVVYDQVPASGSIAVKDDRVHVTLGPENRLSGATVIMPALTGMSLRDALRKATESGLMVKISGTGRVVKQSPSSGTRVSVGESCMLQAAG